MRSLFAKTLLWFLATTAVAILGVTVTTALTVRNSESRQSPFAMLLALQVEEAKRAYEAGGSTALAGVLSRFASVTQEGAVFTDSEGRDLVTGQIRPDLKKRMKEQRRRRPLLSTPWNRQVVIARPDASREYWLFLFETRRSNSSLFWFLDPQQIWVVGIVVLLCYGFAYHLTSPVQRLQKAVDRFGRGEFLVRAQTNRRDELGQLARTFNEMADRIQTLLQAERRLLQDISHELRSPLARLGVAVELARSGAGGSGTFDRIEREAERLNTLVGELLQVTRAEGDPSQQKRDPVQMDQLLTDLVYDSEIEAAAKGCRITFAGPGRVVVAGDEELLRRAIENIVRNAIRYAPAGSAIEIDLKHDAGRVIVQVRDYGPGVPDESLTRIFDAFYRVDTDRNRNSGGVGLGLAIARRAIQLHKGSLYAENVHPGLRVIVDLPAAPEPAASTAERAPALTTQ